MIEIPASEMANRHDPDALAMSPPPAEIQHAALVGQERARDAIQLSASIGHSLFNLFVSGPAGSGRHAEVLRILTRHAVDRPAPGDWVYVNNFDDPQKPRALELPAGKAILLRAYRMAAPSR